MTYTVCVRYIQQLDQRRYKRNLPIVRCEKCGKSFLNKSEVERHKVWEHPVPVSPFEERPAGKSRNNSNNGDNNNYNVSPEDVQRLTSDVLIGSNNKDTSSRTTTEGGVQRKKVDSRPFKIY